jgi:Tfp pilus assembly protein PilF
MRRRSRWRMLVIAGLMPQAGCALWGNDLQLLAPPVTLPATVASKEPGLAPEKAAQACVAAAQSLEQKGYEAEAIAEYERARQFNASIPVARRLAVLYDRQGEVEKARAEYALALKAQPKDADLLNDFGYFHYEHGNWTEAEKWLRESVAVNAGHQRAWVNLGMALGQQERYEDSYAAFAKVLSPAEARCNVGVIMARNGKTAEAEKMLREALSEQPDLKQGAAVLGYLEKRAATAHETGVSAPSSAGSAVKQKSPANSTAG